MSRIESVTTKAEDIVVTPDGRYISPSVLTHPFKPFDSIRKSQVIQEEASSIVVKLHVAEDFGPEEEGRLVASLAERLGEEVYIAVRYVEEIPPEPSGKFRWVVSRVDHEAAVSWQSDGGAGGTPPSRLD